MSDTIALRDLRISKNISQDKAAEAAGVSYSVYTRIEEGSGRTTTDEQANIRKVLEGMEPGTRKLAGRPFSDPAKQAAVKEALEKGTSVAAALGQRVVTEAPAGTEEGTEAPAKAKAKGKADSDAAALSKKAPSRAKGKAAKKEEVAAPAEAEVAAAEPEAAPAEGDAGTSSVGSLLP